MCSGEVLISFLINGELDKYIQECQTTCASQTRRQTGNTDYYIHQTAEKRSAFLPGMRHSNSDRKMSSNIYVILTKNNS